VFNAFTQPLTGRSLAILAAGALLFIVGLVGWLIDRENRMAPARGTRG
jgi:hypothetical protein